MSITSTIRTVMTLLGRGLRPLASRKIRQGLATVIAALAIKQGLGWSDTSVYAVLTVGASWILGTAVEDHGVKSAGMEWYKF